MPDKFHKKAQSVYLPDVDMALFIYALIYIKIFSDHPSSVRYFSSVRSRAANKMNQVLALAELAF